MINLSPAQIVAGSDFGLALFALLADAEATKAQFEQMKAEAQGLLDKRAEIAEAQKALDEKEADLADREQAEARLSAQNKKAVEDNQALAASLKAKMASLADQAAHFDAERARIESEMSTNLADTKTAKEQAEADSAAAADALKAANALKDEYEAKVAKLKEIAA